MFQRKRSILLLEMVISLILFGIIIGILFSSYREFSIAKISIAKDKTALLEKQKLQLRLGQIFSQLKTLKIEDGACKLTYDNGLDPEPEFRGILEAMLYLDKGRLAFVSWPEKGVGRKEILLDKTDSFALEFFDSKKGVWTSQFPEQKPLMMKMKIDKTTYPFFL